MLADPPKEWQMETQTDFGEIIASGTETGTTLVQSQEKVKWNRREQSGDHATLRCMLKFINRAITLNFPDQTAHYLFI